jgi:hypothetical protein
MVYGFPGIFVAMVASNLVVANPIFWGHILYNILRIFLLAENVTLEKTYNIPYCTTTHM